VLFTKYYWDDEIKKNEVGEACGAHKKINGYNILTGESVGKRPLGRCKRR
jgi:hypothetical protein